jgi:hypothetical protein
MTKRILPRCTLLLLVLAVMPGRAQFIQQGNKLAGNDVSPMSASHLGISVALSADGNTAIAGGRFDGNFGAAWVFTRNGSDWSQQGSKLVPNDPAGSPLFGSSAALSADGNTALIGGESDNNGVGAAVVNAVGHCYLTSPVFFWEGGYRDGFSTRQTSRFC